MTADTLHARMIAAACRDHGWQLGNWQEALAQKLSDAQWHNPNYDEVPDVLEMAAHVWGRPDAWKIREEAPEPGQAHAILVLDFLEVEVTHHIEDDKLANYETLWWGLDASDIMELQVYRLDRFGILSPLLTKGTITDLQRREPPDDIES